MQTSGVTRYYDLDSVDLVRQRTGVNYEKARDALAAAEGDIVDALVWLEQRGWSCSGELNEFVEQVIEQASEVMVGKRVEEVGFKLSNMELCRIPTAISGLTAAVVVFFSELLSKCTIELKTVLPNATVEPGDNQHQDHFRD
jgi:hypothetical protein